MTTDHEGHEVTLSDCRETRAWRCPKCRANLAAHVEWDGDVDGEHVLEIDACPGCSAPLVMESNEIKAGCEICGAEPGTACSATEWRGVRQEH